MPHVPGQLAHVGLVMGCQDRRRVAHEGIAVDLVIEGNVGRVTTGQVPGKSCRRRPRTCGTRGPILWTSDTPRGGVTRAGQSRRSVTASSPRLRGHYTPGSFNFPRHLPLLLEGRAT